jgi:hypothetical protein
MSVAFAARAAVQSTLSVKLIRMPIVNKESNEFAIETEKRDLGPRADPFHLWGRPIINMHIGTCIRLGVVGARRCRRRQ